MIARAGFTSLRGNILQIERLDLDQIPEFHVGLGIGDRFHIASDWRKMLAPSSLSEKVLVQLFYEVEITGIEEPSDGIGRSKYSLRQTTDVDIRIQR